MKDKISIIIPIYNSEPFLRHCIDSVLHQTYTNLEVILVDDGSTDESGKICAEYERLDNRVMAISQKNSGVTEARKTAVSASSGNYLFFLDSDDWITLTALEEMYQLAKEHNADMVQSVLVKYSGEGKEVAEVCGKLGLYVNQEEGESCSFRHMFFTDNQNISNIRPYLANKLWAVTAMKPYILSIPSEIKIAEDACVVYSAVPFMERLYIDDKQHYFYRQHSGSVMKRDIEYNFSNLNKLKQLELLFVYMKEGYRHHQRYELLLGQLKAYHNYQFSVIFDSMFPSELVEKSTPFCFNPERVNPTSKKTKIIIYGMSFVGKSFFKQSNMLSNMEVVALVDRGLEGSYIQDLLVRHPKEIKHINFDLIILGCHEKNMAKAIKKDLVEQYQVEEALIYWQEPENIGNKFFPIS